MSNSQAEQHENINQVNFSHHFIRSSSHDAASVKVSDNMLKYCCVVGEISRNKAWQLEGGEGEICRQ